MFILKKKLKTKLEATRLVQDYLRLYLKCWTMLWLRFHFIKTHICSALLCQFLSAFICLQFIYFGPNDYSSLKIEWKHL